jgi:hypothetical protein
VKNTALANHTKIIIICSTIFKDQTYEKIREYVENNFEYEFYDDIFNENDENIIDLFMKNEKEKSKQKINQKGENENKINIIKTNVIKYTPIEDDEIKNNNDLDETNQKGEKEEYIYPDFMIIIDDMGETSRNNKISQLLKTNRHYKSKVIISSQNLEDLAPASIRNLDYILLFPNIPEEKLYKIKSNLLLDIDFNLLFNIYKKITEKKYNFLYIDIRAEEYRENFNKRLIF